jgi:cytochrome bd-type quinol oxidase subunit 1
MFSKGQILFAIFFFVAFVIGISWAYSKDKKSNKEFFKGSYKILIFALIVFFILFGLVKLKHFLF